MSSVQASGSKKIKKTVEKNMTKEVAEKARTYQGIKLEKGIPQGKLVIRTGEVVVIPGRDKKKMLEYMGMYGVATLCKEPIDEASEGHYNTVEIYKVKPAHGEVYFWFVEYV